VLDGASVAALHSAIEAGIEHCRVLVLEGADGSFCGGLDLEHLADDRAATTSARAYARCLEALRFATCPTIAVVDGAALGGGLGLAAACDVVVATRRASFGLPELLFGLLPAIVLPVLLERTSAQRLRLLALRACTVDAEEARSLGLVDEIVPADKLAQATQRWARVLGRPEANAVAHLKRFAISSLSQAFEHGAKVTAERLEDPAVLAAARKFSDGEVAPWLLV
jgi:enoyl-CoA hydratase/carnithine racemase